MAADYTQWPLAADIQKRLTSAGVTLRLTGSDLTDRIQEATDEVIGEVTKKTNRQFVADTEDTTRIYDGSGTPELEVDEMVSLTSVNVASFFGLSLPQTETAVVESEVPTGAIDGDNKIFTFEHAPSPPQSLHMVIDGLVKLYGVDFTLSLNVATLTGLAPDVGAAVWGFYSYIYPATPDSAFTLLNASLIQEQNRPKTRIVVAKGSYPALISGGVMSPIPAVFIAGRQNIHVTGRFGFATSIPTDLWNAVCGEIALRLSQEAIFVQEGRLTEWSEGNEKEKYSLDTSVINRWHDTYTETRISYKRSSGRRLRNLRPPII